MISSPKKYKKILLVKLRFHGDMLLTTPLISSIKSHYPDADLDVLLYTDTKPILSENPDINELYGITRKPKKLSRKLSEFYRLLKELKANKYDLVINLADQWPIAFLIKMLNTRSIAFDFLHRQSPLWKHCFTDLVAPIGEHTIEQNISILSPLQISVEQPKTSLHYSREHWISVKNRSAGVDVENSKYVVIQPTARQIFKCWDDDKFAIVIDHLKEKGYEVILTSGPSKEDQEMVESIAKYCINKPITALAGNTSLLELAALIDHADLFVGVDSAPMHMAAALDTPLVCLFGATDYQQWRPWSDKSTLLWAGNYEAMPERTLRDRTYRYLSCIPAQDVIKAIDDMLTQTQK